MHPAYSIIIFTTLSGLGYGLAIYLGFGLLDPQGLPARTGYVLSFGLIAAGLFSSLLHLGNPQRAWRALSQWRSSWLSREGVLAILTFIPLTLNAMLCIFAGQESFHLNVLMIVGSLLTVYCTSMIYASLKSVNAWNTILTPVCYLLFALTGGLVLGSLLSNFGGQPENIGDALFGFTTQVLAIVFLALAWIAKMLWRYRMENTPDPSSPESATGLGSIGKVRLLEKPHALENYLTREMGFKVARKHSEKLWVIAFALGGAVPALALFMSILMGYGVLVNLLLVLATVSHVLGMMVERWLFFAEAKHAVMNYY
ncbi:MAG: dimethyl sulfoxide reductase anchor subunit family protein [Phyllobacterium sp.]